MQSASQGLITSKTPGKRCDKPRYGVLARGPGYNVRKQQESSTSCRERTAWSMSKHGQGEGCVFWGPGMAQREACQE
jgi:hypothetical protein